MRKFIEDNFGISDEMLLRTVLEQGKVEIIKRGELLIASGEGKAEAIYKAFCGPITPECPASILQLHTDVVVVGDTASLSKLIEAGVEVCE